MSFRSRVIAGGRASALAFWTAALGSLPAYAAEVHDIEIHGAHRVSKEFIEANLTISRNREFDGAEIDASVKRLYSVGQFETVNILVSGGSLIVSVKETKMVNQIVFNGNRKIKDDKLAGVVKTKASSPYSKPQLDADIAAVKAAYAAIGRDDVQIHVQQVPVADDFVNIAFVIDESERTKIKSVDFEGNTAYSSSRLAAVISTKKSNFLSFLTRKDVYGEERLAADKDALRKFYVDQGYADFQVTAADAVFDAADKSYTLKFRLVEGSRYRFGPVTISSTVHGLDELSVDKLTGLESGAAYSEKKLQKAVETLSDAATNRGFSFARVRPRVTHNISTKEIEVEFQIDEAERLYIERIVIRGNSRTRDYVIRREFDVSEGDPYNQQLMDKTKRRLEALGYFKSVSISTSAGSASERVVVTVDVEDDSTGSFGIGAGASSSGPVLEASGEASTSNLRQAGAGMTTMIATTALLSPNPTFSDITWPQVSTLITRRARTTTTMWIRRERRSVSLHRSRMIWRPPSAIA